MAKVLALQCDTCGNSFLPDGDVQDYCPVCGSQYGTLECVIDLNHAALSLEKVPLSERSQDSILRYEPLLPFENPAYFPPLRIGQTPVYHVNALAKYLGIRDILIKDDGLNPSGSYKDRASGVVVARALELGYPVVACASTGNAAASLAACCAAVQMPCVVFVPEEAPAAKLTQIAAFGAYLVAVKGSYDQAVDLATTACRKFGWFNRSAGMNPYLVEGKKTGAYELAEFMSFQLPDAVFVGVGDGSVITGICKGFEEFKRLGLIDTVPRVFGVQSVGASVLADAFRVFRRTATIDIRPRTVFTCADSISVGNPREGVRAIKSVYKTGGDILAVTDDDILKSLRLLPQKSGVFSEPAGVIGLSGVIMALEKNILSRSDSAAIFVTGSGLKDIRTAQRVVNLEIETIVPEERALSYLSFLGSLKGKK